MTPIEKKTAIEGWITAARRQLAELEDGKASIQPIRRRRYRVGHGIEDSAVEYTVAPSEEVVRNFMIEHTRAFIRAKEADLRRARFEAADYAEALAVELRAEARNAVTRTIGGDA